MYSDFFIYKSLLNPPLILTAYIPSVFKYYVAYLDVFPLQQTIYIF